jgi:hypothetical protein
VRRFVQALLVGLARRQCVVEQYTSAPEVFSYSLFQALGGCTKKDSHQHAVERPPTQDFRDWPQSNYYQNHRKRRATLGLTRPMSRSGWRLVRSITFSSKLTGHLSVKIASCWFLIVLREHGKPAHRYRHCMMLLRWRSHWACVSRRLSMISNRRFSSLSV